MTVNSSTQNHLSTGGIFTLWRLTNTKSKEHLQLALIQAKSSTVLIKFKVPMRGWNTRKFYHDNNHFLLKRNDCVVSKIITAFKSESNLHVQLQVYCPTQHTQPESNHLFNISPKNFTHLKELTTIWPNETFRNDSACCVTRCWDATWAETTHSAVQKLQWPTGFNHYYHYYKRDCPSFAYNSIFHGCVVVLPCSLMRNNFTHYVMQMLKTP